MTASQERKAPVDRHVDESGVAPSSKAYAPPLAPVPDDLRLRVRLDRHRMTVSGRAKVGRGVHAAVNYMVVCLLATLVAGAAAGLCRVGDAGRGPTLAVAAVVFVLVFVVGLVRTSGPRD